MIDMPIYPRVYLVDDDAAVERSLGILLRARGLRVRSFADGAAFLENCPPHAPGCLVTDLRMPRFSGLELQRAMARRGYALPVIFITGHADVATAMRAMKAGAVDFLEKPFAPSRLVNAVQDALELNERCRERRLLPYECDAEVVRPDGTHRWIVARGIGDRDADGKLIGLYGTIQDVTERKLTEQTLRESEEKYRLLFESSRDAFLITASPSWHFIEANRAAVDMFTAGSEARLTALHPWDVSPDMQPDGLPSMEKARVMIEIALREGTHFFEWAHKRLDGTIFPGEVLLTNLRLGDQAVLLSTVRDVTRRKHLEKEARLRLREAEKLQNLQVAAQTAAAFAHELKQPLQAVATYSEAALELPKSENPDIGQMREAMLGCNQQAQRTVVAIHELVGLLGTKRFATESLVLADQLLSVLDVIRREYDTSFEVHLRLDQENLRVQANRTHLRQALLNLMRNGLEAMLQAKATDPTLTVQVSALTEEGIAEITVADNGPGVRREHQANLFEPFFTTNKRGIGMGLTVSRSLAEANGGKLWLNPKEGPGASFHLTLPLAVVAN